MTWFILVTALFAGRFGGQFASRFKDVDWPSGNYGLPRPISGCPGNKASGWNEGWRFQDMEDKQKSTRSSVSIGSHMDVKLIGPKKDMNRTFCMKKNTKALTKYWPKGSYCIYQYKNTPCPMYMNPGWVKWDDENYRNANKKGGSLPEGSYNKDTVIRYCCQNSGNWNDVIELPVSQPFYLLTSNSNSVPKCQMVRWAFSYLEYIIFDTNDQNNRDRQGRKHIFLYGRKLYYCYYKDCRRNFSGPSGSFQSHPISGGDIMDPHSQYCSWLINTAETYVVSLNFKELLIPDCDDMFLKIYDGLNDTAPLLGTYCGSNATKEVKISSSTNHLYIVSNSGRYGANPKSTFSFDVQYNAEHAKRCHYEVMNNTGYLKSPRLATPSNYPHHSNCTWLITVNDAYLIVLNFSFLELHNSDFIEVYDGNNGSATVLARFSPLESDRKNGSLVSSSSMVYVILKYGKPQNEGTKFALNYASQPKPTTTGCHYEVMNNTGYLKSPRLATPSNYPHHSNCTWLITVNDAYLIVLNFSFLELHNSDFIEVYDGSNGSATVLGRYSPLNSDRKTGSLVSSSSMVYIILKYGKPQNEGTKFALNYISQPKPTTTDIAKISQTTSSSIVHSTRDPNKKSAKQSKSNQTTYIIVAVVVTVAVVLILIVVIIFFRRRKRKAGVSTTLHSTNPSYTWRKQAGASDEDSDCYANPTPQEKIWVGNSKVCKESSNPIYEPADGQEPAALYTSTENTYEPLVGNQGRALESENPLYGVGDIAASHIYAEPSSPRLNVYDEPNVKVSREAKV